ncbi:MAG TPA: tRNA dihydrouridine synthase DusB [Desulfurivibrio alkaliphilus]|uniref:tRNA-dihydrouridine synthase n=1 Tax=Desulfurivibrio alkaliphilus TaxID=427923 RepID=A0A7C2XPC3_9BACT|nr:tRNA dihydrouridine synthase DusB [Desulfurivibrio alkaliphilus]
MNRQVVEAVLRIGGITASSPLVAAPLAGYSDLAFRLLCREYGAGICWSEMISCHGVVRRQPRTLDLAATVAAERPVIMQLFGAEPEIMAEAAAILSELPIDGIDINMGCPVRKVVKRGAGSALMKEPRLAANLTRAVVAATKLPVTVKIRSGWNHQAITAPEFAKMLADCGTAAITIHGRTWSDGFAGRADRRVIAAVKAAVDIPVIGNGDINSHGQALAMMTETGCDGVMIGRGALGAPWVFTPHCPDHLPLAPRLRAALRHLLLLREFHPRCNPIHARNQLGRYFRALPNGALLRKQIYDLGDPDRLEEFLRGLLAGEQQEKTEPL